MLVIALVPIEDSEAARRKKPRKATNYYAPPQAAFVINADTGAVLYEKNAYEKRFPASLTKMMTLYLTFEALKEGKLKLDQKLSVSKKAASQPQTNIALKAGSTITVRKCIESLVIRSANDASVVLAEGIGTSEWNFAQMMTRKAQSLGMKNTVFKNPNGLPNPLQYTTASDMAKLGIALRKHFPEYYGYFKLRSFSYNGRTYKTHNRVLDRFGGADGIKTGYINASGFNLVTSVKRDGHNIVGVVMGGRSARLRDDEMVRLLGNAFKNPSKPSVQTAALDTSENPISGNDQTAIVDTSGRAITSRGFAPSSPERVWGIQVGAFLKSDEALNAANQAVKLAKAELRSSVIAVDGKDKSLKKIHRARIVDLTEQQARLACQKLVTQQSGCFVYRADKEQNS